MDIPELQRNKQIQNYECNYYVITIDVNW